MDAFINLFKKDSEVRIKISNILDRYNRIPLEYQSKIGYDSLFQNVILKELVNIMNTTIPDSDLEIKMKISRIIFLESIFL